MPGQTLVQSRWRSCESFSGRVFFGGLDNEDYGGSIVFSKLIDSKDDIGECYQQNDPTSEHLSTLLPTDGGVIHLPDADKILLRVLWLLMVHLSGGHVTVSTH